MPNEKFNSTSKVTLELIRYLFTGLINTLFGLTVSVLFLKILSHHYIICMALSTPIGIVFSFVTHQKITFRLQFDYRALPKYILVYLLIFIINILLMGILIKAGIERTMALIYIFPFIVIITYILQKLYVFQK